MTNQDDSGFGCAAFGHLASASLDGELPLAEMDRFATHLPGCADCQRLCQQYRAIDIAAMPAYPRPSETDWAAAWNGIEAGIRQDRTEAAASPAAGVLRFVGRALPGSPWVTPLAAALAAATLIGVTLALRQASDRDRPAVIVAAGTAPGSELPEGPTTAVAAHFGGGAEVMDVSCQAGWEPIVWTLGGDDPMTIVQCQSVEI